MAIQEHYLIHQAIITPGSLQSPEGVRILADKTFVEDTDSELRGTVDKQPLLDTPGINGQVTAMMAIVLTAAKQHFGSQNVEWAEPPESP